MRNHGFCSNFLINNWNEFLNVALMFFKLIIVRLIACLPFQLIRKGSKEMRKKAVIYVLYEILVGAPTVMISIGYIFGPHGNTGLINLNSKINMGFLILYPFFLLLIPFLILHFEIKIVRKEEAKERKKKQ